MGAPSSVPKARNEPRLDTLIGKSHSPRPLCGDKNPQSAITTKEPVFTTINPDLHNSCDKTMCTCNCNLFLVQPSCGNPVENNGYESCQVGNTHNLTGWSYA